MNYVSVVARLLGASEPAVADGGLPVLDSREDVVIHRTDPHFGDVEHNEFGKEVFNSQIARQREPKGRPQELPRKGAGSTFVAQAYK